MRRPEPAGQHLWIGDEPAAAPVLLQVLARARHRPLVVLLTAGLLAGGVAAFRATLAPRFEAALYFRLDEGELLNVGATPLPPQMIRDHLSKVALSRSRLEKLLRAHGWSAPLMARDPRAAVESFREDLKVEVARDYFLLGRDANDPPRSALVSVTLAGGDIEQTRSILHEIGELILRDQPVKRMEVAPEARALVDAQLQAARTRIVMLQREIEEGDRLGTGRSADAAAQRAQLAVLEERTLDAIRRAASVEGRLAQIDFAAAAGRERLGLQLELFDETLVTVRRRPTPLHLALLFAAAFAAVLVLVAPVLGAFDDRLLSPDDLVARGMPVFGAVPRFPGDGIGALRARPLAGREPS